MASIKLKSQFQSTRSALFIILILQIQWQLQPSLGDDQVSPALVQAGQNNVSPSTVSLEPTKPEAAKQAESRSQGDGSGDNTGSESTTTLSTFTGSLAEESADGDPGNVGAALAAAAAKRTTVKKELAPTTEPTPTQAEAESSADDESQPKEPNTNTKEQPITEQQQQQPSPLGSLLPSVNGQASELTKMSPGLSSAIGEIAEQLPSVYSREQGTPADDSLESIQRLLPANTNLFDKDAIDATQLGEMDCHMRNLDYCLAGLMGTAQKMLPETDTELETRCDEMRATTSCMAVFNKRCSTFKVLSVLVPFTQQSNLLSPRSTLLSESQKEMVSSATSGIMSQPALGSMVTGGRPSTGSLGSLMEICEPHAKNSPENQDLRKRLFQLAKCINARVPKLTPCIDDLKTATQVFYEPRRVLPMRPTCCALARFRACSMAAIDNVCGLSSFEQLIQSFSGQGGPVSMIKSIDRVCRHATDHRSSYCKEVLPPSGMKTPPKRGNKASKLAKALDLISFSPATQEMG